MADLSHTLADFRHDFGEARHSQVFLAGAKSEDLYSLPDCKVLGVSDQGAPLKALR